MTEETGGGHPIRSPFHFRCSSPTNIILFYISRISRPFSAYFKIIHAIAALRAEQIYA